MNNIQRGRTTCWTQGTVRQPEAAGPERLDHREQNEELGGLV